MSSAAAGTASSERKTILVVEDERIVARDLQKSLSELGYDVPATAASAEQAILIASEHWPHLVLMDIRIKGDRDGIETASALRSRFDVPIIYLTAYADQVTIGRAKQTEPFGYLIKPVTAEALRSAVEIAFFKHDAEKRRKDRERWLETTMRSIGDAIVSTDASGNVNYMNPVAEQLTGWGSADAVGRSPDEVLHLVDGRSHEAVPNPLQAALSQLRTVSIEGAVLREGREERLISNSSSPILSDTGSALGAVMVFRDESERRDLQRQVEMSERLATVGTMAAGVAHEVNNPLTYVMASISWVLGEIRKHRADSTAATNSSWMTEVENALTDADLGAHRVAKIMSDLHAFTQPGPDSQESVNLHEIIDWSLRVADHELRPRASVVRQFGETPLVNAPSGRLGQVFVNLLINAAHALDVKRRDTNEVVIITRTDEEGRAVIEICDNGCGMAPEVMERVFEPFFTTKPVGQGTGLGLSVSYGIAKALGGTIAFKSEEGKGTTAVVTLGVSQSVLRNVNPCAEPAVAKGHVGLS